MTVRTYVVIPFRGKLEMTHYLVRQVDGSAGANRIILLNNGEYQDHYPWDNLSWVETWTKTDVNFHNLLNFGIKRAIGDSLSHVSHEYGDPINVCLMNNDLRLETYDYIQRLSAVLRSDRSLALVTGTEEKFGPEVPEVLYRGPDEGLQSNALMFKAELPFRFDPRFTWYWGDIDFFAQVENAGLSCAIATRARHTHIGGGSQTLKEIDRGEFSARISEDYHLFRKKWPQVPEGGMGIPRELLVPF